MITFLFPIILWVIPIIMFIWYVFFREKIGTIHPNSLIAKNLKTPKNLWFLWFIRAIMITLIVSIISSAQMVQTVIKKTKISQDIMIVFDISLSMLAEDLQPNRIEVAKTIIKNFIVSRTDDRIGLIIFAGKPFIQSSFSTDYHGIASIIKWLSPQFIRQDLPGLSGTNIGDALLLANMAHSGWKSSEKSIILITDWRANLWIDPIISAWESDEQDIHIYTVGIGSVDGKDLFYTNTLWQKNYFYDGSGNILKSDLDEVLMQKIADITNGQYFHASSKNELEKVFANITKKLSPITEDIVSTKSIDLTPILILIFIILFFIERLFLGYIIRKYKII